MAEFSTLARPYAKAVFEIARDESGFEKWGKGLDALAAAVESSDLAELIGNPALHKQDLGDILGKALASQLGNEGNALVRLLVENGRLTLAPYIAGQFEALRAEAESRVDVEITSAAEVQPELKNALTCAVASKLAREVDVTWLVDEALIAGAIIRAGDQVIDASASGDLEKLRQALAA